MNIVPMPQGSTSERMPIERMPHGHTLDHEHGFCSGGGPHHPETELAVRPEGPGMLPARPEGTLPASSQGPGMLPERQQAPGVGYTDALRHTFATHEGDTGVYWDHTHKPVQMAMPNHREVLNHGKPLRGNIGAFHPDLSERI